MTEGYKINANSEDTDTVCRLASTKMSETLQKFFKVLYEYFYTLFNYLNKDFYLSAMTVI